MNNLIVLDHEREASSDSYLITDHRRISHVSEVLRASIGDKIRICLVNVGIGEAKIIELIPQSLRLQLLRIPIPLFTNNYHSKIHLMLGLSRPPTCRKILEHATSLGVSSFNFFKAELSEKSYADSKIFKDNAYLTQLYDGLSQSGIYHQLPTCSVHHHIPKKIIDSDSSSSLKLILHPHSSFSIFDLNSKIDKFNNVKNIYLAIGPERGWTNGEREYFLGLGFQEISISQSILRVEIATFVILGQIELMQRRGWNSNRYRK